MDTEYFREELDTVFLKSLHSSIEKKNMDRTEKYLFEFLFPMIVNQLAIHKA